MPAYGALLNHAYPNSVNHQTSLEKELLLIAAEDSIARLVAELPVRATGSAAAMLAGEPLGIVISVGVTAWSIETHEQDKPRIELRLRETLNKGLQKMWAILIRDPELGVMVPVKHMTHQIESNLFQGSALKLNSKRDLVFLTLMQKSNFTNSPNF